MPVPAGCRETKKAPKSAFDRRSFRWKRVSKRTRLLIGCPKGEWSRGRCRVGTRVYKAVKCG